MGLSNDECNKENESDNYDSDDSYNGDSSSDESSFDEMAVGVALELPKRANRGKKLVF